MNPLDYHAKMLALLEIRDIYFDRPSASYEDITRLLTQWNEDFPEFTIHGV